AAPVQAEQRSIVLAVTGMERELHLVPVTKALGRADDGEHVRIGKAAQMREGFAYLIFLGRELLLVGEILEAAAAALARAIVRARCVDTVGARLETLDGPRLGEALAAAEHAGAHAVAGKGIVHEDDEALPVSDALAAQGEPLDGDFDLFVLA